MIDPEELQKLNYTIDSVSVMHTELIQMYSIAKFGKERCEQILRELINQRERLQKGAVCRETGKPELLLERSSSGS